MKNFSCKIETRFTNSIKTTYQLKRNNIKYNNKVQKKYISSYENQREYSEKFLESLYANFD